MLHPLEGVLVEEEAVIRRRMSHLIFFNDYFGFQTFKINFVEVRAWGAT